MSIQELEAKIYAAYYDQNPDGDARFDVWPDVIEAKKCKDPIAELTKLLKQWT